MVSASQVMLKDHKHKAESAIFNTPWKIWPTNVGHMSACPKLDVEYMYYNCVSMIIWAAYSYIYPNINTHMHACIPTFLPTYLRNTYMHAYIHAYTQIYIHTYMQALHMEICKTSILSLCELTIFILCQDINVIQSSIWCYEIIFLEFYQGLEGFCLQHRTTDWIFSLCLAEKLPHMPVYSVVRHVLDD